VRKPFWWSWPYGFRLWLVGWLIVVGMIVLVVVYR
jgi:hypothetical protein